MGKNSNTIQRHSKAVCKIYNYCAYSLIIMPSHLYFTDGYNALNLHMFQSFAHVVFQFEVLLMFFLNNLELCSYRLSLSLSCVHVIGLL